MKEKNLSLELLKFFAVICVANSHMGQLYVRYNILATGGAIGDVLFFFSSGFTLFLGRFGRFDNWYKRRVKRIYPSILAWAFVLSLLGLRQFTFIEIVLGGGCWFIKCIMIYYIVLYLIRKYFPEKPKIPFLLVGLIILVWYYFEDSSFFFMYNQTYFKWAHYFLFMLLGAYVGNKIIIIDPNPKKDIFLFFCNLIVFYGILLMSDRNHIFAHFQIISLIPLIGIVIYLYKLCCINQVNRFMYTNKGKALRFISGLCLEAYIVQGLIIRNEQLLVSLRPIFPFNILLTFVLIILAAYFLRCLARCISQIFEKEDFNWNVVFKLVD